MAYAAKWPLTETNNARLPLMIREYMDSVIGDSVSFVTWNRLGCRYAHNIKNMTSLWGSMISDIGLYIAIPDNFVSWDERSAFLRTVFDPDNNIERIQEFLTRVRRMYSAGDKRTLAVIVNVAWKDRNIRKGHATLLFMDLRAKQQVFVDGHGQGSKLKALCEVRPIIPGFYVVPANEVLNFPSIQTYVEINMEDEQVGVCGLITIMIVMLCRRFNYWHVPTMCMAFMDAYPNTMSAALMMQTLVYLYESKLMDLGGRTNHDLTLNDKKELFKTLFPAGYYCGVYSESSGKFCKRPACTQGPVHAHCWQHRNIMQSPYRQSKKCIAEF